MIAALVALAVAASPAPLPNVPATAVIVNGGSTNAAGYRIELHADGTAIVTAQRPLGAAPGGSTRTTIAAPLVQRFFADLHAAGDLSALPSTHCMKSASFGSTLRVAYLGKSTPDLSCPSTSAAARAVADDAQAIANAVVTAAPARRVR